MMLHVRQLGCVPPIVLLQLCADGLADSVGVVGGPVDYQQTSHATQRFRTSRVVAFVALAVLTRVLILLLRAKPNCRREL